MRLIPEQNISVWWKQPIFEEYISADVFVA